MKVLSIDPGERVGYATATVGKVHSSGTIPPALWVETHGIAFLKDFALKLHETIGNYDVVILEDYRISAAKLRQHTGSNVPTLQLIGMVRLCCWLHPTVKLVVQTPAAQGSTAEKVIRANPVFVDIAERLDKLPKTHDESHDGSALRHLATWFWRNYL